jgi:hypothetical protein
LCGKNNQIISKKNNQDKVFGKNNQNNNQENNQADYFYRTGPISLSRHIAEISIAAQAGGP